VSCWRGQRGPSSGHEVLIGRVRGSGRSIYDVYILLEDVEVLRRLSPEPFAPASGRLTLEGTAGAEVLERMLRTGRCHWLGKDAPALALGDSRAGTPAWEIAHDGHQRLVFHSEEAVRLVAPLSPPWYIDPDQNRCGPLETPLEPTLAGTLASAPPLSPAQVQAFASQLTERFPDIAIPRPREVQIKDLRSAPTPCLRPLEDNLARDLGRTPYPDSEMLSVSVARLGFDYGGHRLEPELDEETTAPVVKDGDGLLRIHRDRGGGHARVRARALWWARRCARECGSPRP